MREPWSGASNPLVLVDSAVAVQFIAAVLWSRTTLDSRFDAAAARSSSTSAVRASEARATAPLAAAARGHVVVNALLIDAIARALKGARITATPSAGFELDVDLWGMAVPRNLRLRPYPKWKRRSPLIRHRRDP